MRLYTIHYVTVFLLFSFFFFTALALALACIGVTFWRKTQPAKTGCYMYILQEVVQRARSARLRQFCSYDFLKILWVDRGVHLSRVGPKKAGSIDSFSRYAAECVCWNADGRGGA